MARPHGRVSLVSITTDSARRVGEKAPIAPKRIAVSTSSSGPGITTPARRDARTVSRMPSRSDASGGRRTGGSGSPPASRLNGCGPCVCGSTAIASTAGGLAIATRRPASVSASSDRLDARLRPDELDSRLGQLCPRVVETIGRRRRGIAGRACPSPLSDLAESPRWSSRRPRPAAGSRPGAGTTDEDRFPPASARRRGFAPDTRARALLRSGSRSGSPRRPMASRRPPPTYASSPLERCAQRADETSP